MSESSGTRRVKLAVDALGYGQLEVDGRDLTEEVMGVTIQSEARQPTQVMVVLTPREETEFDGQAIVQYAKPVDERPDGEIVATFLSRVSPKALEEATLARMDLSNDRHGLTEGLLKQLQDWALGKQ